MSELVINKLVNISRALFFYIVCLLSRIHSSIPVFTPYTLHFTPSGMPLLTPIIPKKGKKCAYFLHFFLFFFISAHLLTIFFNRQTAFFSSLTIVHFRYPCATFALPLYEDCGVQVTVTTVSTVGIFLFLVPVRAWTKIIILLTVPSVQIFTQD